MACFCPYNGVNYYGSYQVLATPSHGRSWSSLTKVSLGSVEFRVWTESPGGGYLQAGATELGGLVEAFVLTNPASGSNATWISPDEELGARWIGGGSGVVEIGLLAAEPMPTFATGNVTLSSAAQNCTGNDTAILHGQWFMLGVRGCLRPGGRSWAGSEGAVELSSRASSLSGTARSPHAPWWEP